MTRPPTPLLRLAVALSALVGLGLVTSCRLPWKRHADVTEADLPVKLATAASGDVKVRLNEVGTIEPLVKVDVKSTLSGKVVDLLVREGDSVEEGQVLARVEPDVNQAQGLASVRSSERRTSISLGDARRQYDVQKRLFDEGLAPKDSLDRARTDYERVEEEARAAGEQVAIAVESGIPLRGVIRPTQRVNVASPMKGVVIARPVEIGETITSGVSSFNAGTVLFTVADLSRVLVKAQVNEVDVGKLRIGQATGIGIDAFPFQRFTGTITFISPAAKTLDKVKVFDVEVTPREQHAEFRPGMTANVTIEGDERHGVLTVPTEALFQRDDRDVVFVLRPDFRSRLPKDLPPPNKGRRDLSPYWKELFEVRPVEAGLTSVERSEITAGLHAGERVALDDPAKPPAQED